MPQSVEPVVNRLTRQSISEAVSAPQGRKGQTETQASQS